MMLLPPHLVIPISSAVVHSTIRGLHLATVSQYLSVAGLVALLYDHILTFGDEINLIRTTPRSFLKWIFLTNHYLVELCLITVAMEMSGFNDVLNDDRRFISAVASYGLISTFVANLLGFLRVIILWDKSPRVVLGLSIAFTMSFLTAMACMVRSLMIFESSITHDPSSNLCYLAKSVKTFIVLWATPLAFDITVLGLIIYNSLSNPRDFKTTLKRVLYRDGILFFLLVALIRASNLVFVIAADPALAGIPAYFSWAIITLACRRLLIHIHSCEQEAAYYDELQASLHSSMKSNSESAIELHGYMANCR